MLCKAGLKMILLAEYLAMAGKLLGLRHLLPIEFTQVEQGHVVKPVSSH